MEDEVDRMLATPPFAGLAARENANVHTPTVDLRGTLQAAGAPSAAESVAAATARRGITAA